MPRLVTMTTMITRCQQRCDQENSSHIATNEWKQLISEQYGDLFGVVAGTGLRYFETTDTITTDGSTSYDEPSDVLAVVSVIRSQSDGSQYELTEIGPQEQILMAGQMGSARYYAHVDDKIILYPNPSGTETYLVRYIPQSPDLSSISGGDTLDLVTPDGEAFMIWGVAVKALAKSESNVQLAIAEREAARARLLEWAQLEAFTQPRRQFVVDEYGDDGAFDPASWRFNRP